MRYVATSCIALLLFASTASADWLEASSDHFVIYGDQPEKQIRGFAERLERFHTAMSYVFKKPQAKPSPSNRVTIFVVSNQSEVRKVAGTDNRYVAGFYDPRAGISVAVIPESTSRSGLSGETVLYHEYAHHFMSGLTARTYPRWFVEGFAEFFGGVRFGSDGTVRLGAPPQHRLAELRYAEAVPIRRMLDFDGGASDAGTEYDAFYGQSWLLFHYLQMEPDRAGQLSKYEKLLAAGTLAIEAAEGAFGNLDQLERDMKSYQRRRTINTLVVDGNTLQSGPIAIRTLRPGEAAIMPTVIESRVGVSSEEALALLPEARKVAASYPDDPAVLAALAEAEFDAGNDDAAIAAADRAIAIDPNQINAQIQKGYALFRKVETGALPKESWKDVRSQFVKANKVEQDNPIPLVRYYLTYLEQGVRPTENAVTGLEWAMQLAPFDDSVRWLAAQQMVTDGRLREAAYTLAPLAYSPHPGEQTDSARRLLKEVETRMAGANQPSPEPTRGN
jgi:tetratricopeptide (TPR) repeat protein